MLLDTSGLLCLFHRGERHHAKADEVFHAARRKLTHNYVLAEFVALAEARRLPRDSSLLFLAGLLENLTIRVVWVDEALHGLGCSSCKHAWTSPTHYAMP